MGPVLGIDPGTAVTGYGVVSQGEDGRYTLLECGVIRTSAEKALPSGTERSSRASRKSSIGFSLGRGGGGCFSGEERPKCTHPGARARRHPPGGGPQGSPYRRVLAEGDQEGRGGDRRCHQASGGVYGAAPPPPQGTSGPGRRRGWCRRSLMSLFRGIESGWLTVRPLFTSPSRGSRRIFNPKRNQRVR